MGCIDGRLEGCSVGFSDGHNVGPGIDAKEEASRSSVNLHNENKREQKKRAFTADNILFDHVRSGVRGTYIKFQSKVQ